MQTPLERMADFDLSDEQREVRRAVREFAEKEILPHVERHEREARYPLELIAKLPPLGLMGPLIPESYGGSFSDVLSYGIICEELARIDWVIASVVSVSNSLVASSILRFGSDAQKQRWLPRIADGSCLTSACLTEPGGGTDLPSMQTTAKRVAGRLAARRHQGVHLARRPRRALLRGGDARPRAEAQGRDCLPGRSEVAGHHDRRVPDAHAQARQPGRGALRGRLRARRGTARRAGRRLPGARLGARHGPLLGGRALRRPGAARARPRRSLRHAAPGLRPEDRRVPADPAEGRRHDLPHAGRARRSSTSSAA